MQTPWALTHRHPRYANPVSCLLHDILLPKEAPATDKQPAVRS